MKVLLGDTRNQEAMLLMRLFHVVSVSKQDRMMYNYKSLFETTLSGTLNCSVELIFSDFVSSVVKD